MPTTASQSDRYLDAKRKPRREERSLEQDVAADSRGIAIFLFLPIASVAGLMFLLSLTQTLPADLAVKWTIRPWGRIQILSLPVALGAGGLFAYTYLGKAGWQLRALIGLLVGALGLAGVAYFLQELVAGERVGRAMGMAVVIVVVGASLVHNAWRERTES